MNRFIRQGLVLAALAGIGALQIGTAKADISVSRQGDSRVTRVSIDSVSVSPVEKSGQSFQRFELRGVDGHAGVLYREGSPEIPVVRFFANEGVKVRVLAAPSVTVLNKSQGSIVPVLPSAAKMEGAVAPFVMNKAAYASTESYPAQPYTIEPAGSVGGKATYLVTLHPVSWVAATGEYRTTQAFEILDKDDAPAAAGLETFAFVVGKRFEASPSLKAYMDLKARMGFQVKTIVVGRGINTPDQVRAELKKLYRETAGGLKYALIIGDAEDVPGKPSTIISGTTDHYYAAIDTDNYLTDMNGPDLAVGRVSVSNEQELKAATDKFTRYTMGTFSRTDWLNKISWVGTDDRYEVAEGTHNYVIENYTRPAGFLGVFPSTRDAMGGDKLYAITHHATGADVLAAAKEGRTLIQYSGHGAETYFAGPHLGQSDVRSLTDTGMLPMVVGNACITGNFTVSESFAETWIRHPAGAIMYWGSMDSSYWDEDDVLERVQHDGLFKSGLSEFGAMTMNALKGVWLKYGGQGRSSYYWETYHVFGDPSISLRLKKVSKLSLLAPMTLSRTDRALEVTVKDETGALVKDARVALTSADRSFTKMVKTDANGKAMLEGMDLGRVAAGTSLDLLVTAAQAEAKSMQIALQ